MEIGKWGVGVGWGSQSPVGSAALPFPLAAPGQPMEISGCWWTQCKTTKVLYSLDISWPWFWVFFEGNREIKELEAGSKWGEKKEDSDILANRSTHSGKPQATWLEVEGAAWTSSAEMLNAQFPALFSESLFLPFLSGQTFHILLEQSHCPLCEFRIYYGDPHKPLVCYILKLIRWQRG